ncbi:MAG: hypothetical protein ACLRP4_00595 [Dialister invisus]
MVKKEVLLDINGRNDHIAQHVKEHLEERHIFAVNIMGRRGRKDHLPGKPDPRLSGEVLCH